MKTSSGIAGMTAAAFLQICGSTVVSADPGPGVIADRCTNQINYAGDPRSNAEINGIGATTGKCPTPIAAGSTGTPTRSTSLAVPTVGDASDRAFLFKLVNAGIAIPNAQAAERAIAIAHQGCELSGSVKDPLTVTQKVVAANNGIEPGTVSRVLGSGIMHYCPEILADVPLH